MSGEVRAQFLFRSFIPLPPPAWAALVQGDTSSFFGIYYLVLKHLSLPEEKWVKFRRRHVQIFFGSVHCQWPPSRLPSLSNFTAPFKGNGTLLMLSYQLYDDWPALVARQFGQAVIILWITHKEQGVNMTLLDTLPSQLVNTVKLSIMGILAPS